MGNSIFGIGVSGLNTAQVGLTTTSHNIANANTAGYHRQEAVQATNLPVFTGAGYLGQGVHVETVRRMFSQFLDNQVTEAQNRASHLDAYYAQIQQLDNMLADPNAGLSPALQDFFKGAANVAANPASVPSRQTLLSAAQSLASRFQTLEDRFTRIRNALNTQIASTVDTVNSFAQQIADLNARIISVDVTAGRQPPNDLLDRRDDLVAQLNQQIKATVLKQDDGSYNIFIGSGQALVVGRQAYSLAAIASPDDPQQLDVGYAAGTNPIRLSADNLQGGTLGGLLAFRNEILDGSENALGRVAIGLAEAFNDQHRLGQDLNGALGGNFFNAPAATVLSRNGNTTLPPAVTISDVSKLTTSDYRLKFTDAAGGFVLTRLSDNATVASPAGEGLQITPALPTMAGDTFLIQPTRYGAHDIGVAVSDPAKIAAAAPIRATAALSNTGSGKISAGIVNVPPPPDANLQQPVTITFTSPTTYDVSGAGTGNPSGLGYVSGGNIAYNGFTVQITGTPAAGDTFAIGPNTGGVSDNRNALLLAALQTGNVLAGGTASLQDAYGQIVSQVGNKTRELGVTSKAQTNLVSQTQQAQQSVSGVNLDEEAANLIRYQQAYQAAGKAIQVASVLFDTLLGLGR